MNKLFWKRLKPSLGIGYFLLASTFICCMDACIKSVADTHDLMQVVFARNFFAFIPLAFTFMRQKEVKRFRTASLLSHFIRALLGVVAMLGFAYGFKNMTIASVYAIEFTAPFFMLLMGAFFFRETILKQQWLMIVLGFLGVMIIIRPHHEHFEFSSVAVLVAAGLFAWNAFHVKLLAKKDQNFTVVFYFLFFCTLITGVFLPFVWETPTFPDFLRMMGVGIFNGLAQIYLSKAIDHAPVSTLAPFYYSIMIWGILFGFVFWGDVPQTHVMFGATIVIGCGMYSTYISNKNAESK